MEEREKRLPSNTRPCPRHPSPAQEQTKLPSTTALKAELASIREKWTRCGVREQERGRGQSFQLASEEMAIVPSGGVKKRAEVRQDKLKPIQDGVVNLGMWLLQ